MPSKKKAPSDSQGASARRRQQSMPGAETAETPVALGMSGEEEMPESNAMDVEPSTERADEMDFASAVAAMTGSDMPAGEMSSAEDTGGGVAGPAPPRGGGGVGTTQVLHPGHATT